MKTIGILGGMSWVSTALYYKHINKQVQRELGGSSSAKILLWSFNFAEIENQQKQGKWKELTQKLLHAAHALEAAGADMLLIATNTMHICAAELEKKINIPLIHITDATGELLVNKNIKKVALLGTRYVIEHDFYRGMLQEKYHLDVFCPKGDHLDDVHNIIFNELCRNIFKDSSRKRYVEIIEKLQNDGAQAVILGCTEIGLLIKASDISIPIFDTCLIHASAAAKAAILKT